LLNKNREIYNIACKSKVLTCLEMLFVRLVDINDLIICYSYCVIIYSDNSNNNNKLLKYSFSLLNFVSSYCEVLIKFLFFKKKLLLLLSLSLSLLLLL